MLLLCKKLNEVLNVSCIHNSKLGPTHYDPTSADSMNTGMPVPDNIPRLLGGMLQSVKPSVVIDVVF